MYDVNRDRTDELLIGYKDYHKNFFITGIYWNKNHAKTASNTKAITLASQKIILTKNHLMIRKDHGTYNTLFLNDYGVIYKSSIGSNLKSYLKDKETSVYTLKGDYIKDYYKKETNGGDTRCL